MKTHPAAYSIYSNAEVRTSALGIERARTRTAPVDDVALAVVVPDSMLVFPLSTQPVCKMLTLYLLGDHANTAVLVRTAAVMLALWEGIASVRGNRGAQFTQLATFLYDAFAAIVARWGSLGRASEKLRVTGRLSGSSQNGGGEAYKEEEGSDVLHRGHVLYSTRSCR